MADKGEKVATPSEKGAKVMHPPKKKDEKDKKDEKEKKPEPPTMLLPRQVIAAHSGNQYLVDRLLGKGGFGEVYKVSLLKEPGKTFAMKVEPNTMPNSQKMLRLKVETHVFETIAASTNALIDKSHFVKMHDRGITATFKYYVMDIIWCSLKDVIDELLDGKTTPSTNINIARQTLAGIDALHELGILHRDIKAANYAVGLPPKENIIYLLDFGISRPFREKDGKVKVARAMVPFMGTLKYASIRSLQNEEQCRRDDLEVWLYMMLYIYDKKNLTWSTLKGNDRPAIIKAKIELMEKSKALEAAGKVKFPKQYHDILTKIYKMEYADAGDFKFFNTKLDEIVREQKIDEKLPLDWVGKWDVWEKKRLEKLMKEGIKKGEVKKEDVKKEEAKKEEPKKEEMKKDEMKKEEVKKESQMKDIKEDELSDPKKKERKKDKKKRHNKDDDDLIIMEEMLLKLVKEKTRLKRELGKGGEKDDEYTRTDENDSEDYTDDDESRRGRKKKRGRKKRERDNSDRTEDEGDERYERNEDRDYDKTPVKKPRRKRSPPAGGRGGKVSKVSKVSRRIEVEEIEAGAARIPEPKKQDEEKARNKGGKQAEKEKKKSDKVARTPEKTPEKSPAKASTPEPAKKAAPAKK